jgi:hypothetical protein
LKQHEYSHKNLRKTSASQTAALNAVNNPIFQNITKLSCTELSVQAHTVTKADNYGSNSQNILHTNKEIRMYGDSEEAAPVSYYSDLQIF